MFDGEFLGLRTENFFTADRALYLSCTVLQIINVFLRE